MSDQRQIFTSLVAQHQNLGDVALRREAVRWIAPCGTLHLLATGAPPRYIEVLDLPAHARLYTSYKSWMQALLSASGRGRAALVYSPGPQALALNARNATDEAMRTSLTAFMRARRNPVIKLGRSFEEPHRFMTQAVRWHDAMSTATYVRDERAMTVTPGATLSPDLALGAFDAPTGGDRTQLALGFRGDRGHDLDALAARADKLASALGVTPVVVTQVEFDQAFNEALAHRLGAEHVSVVPVSSGSFALMEATYARAVAVMSDRLHAQVFGLAQGALPVTVPGPQTKARAAMAAIALPEWASADGSVPWDSLAKAQDQAASVMADARARLVRIRNHVRLALDAECKEVERE